MDWIAVALAVLGLVLLLAGFWKNRRGMLALAGVVLFLAGSLGGFLDRWVSTAEQAEAEARALQATPASTPETAPRPDPAP